MAECIELRTGKVVWEERLKGHGAKSDSWSSMVLSGDKLYVVNQSGDTFVLKASPKFELLNANALSETTMASLAVSNGEVFIRSHNNLWCVAQPDEISMLKQLVNKTVTVNTNMLLYTVTGGVKKPGR